MQKAKKIPMRQCLGCNQHKEKRELIRVVRDPEGNVSLDFTGKKSGRGAYICPKSQCLKKARKARRIESALDCSIPDEVFSQMEASLEESEK